MPEETIIAWNWISLLYNRTTFRLRRSQKSAKTSLDSTIRKVLSQMKRGSLEVSLFLSVKLKLSRIDFYWGAMKLSSATCATSTPTIAHLSPSPRNFVWNIYSRKWILTCLTKFNKYNTWMTYFITICTKKSLSALMFLQFIAKYLNYMQLNEMKYGHLEFYMLSGTRSYNLASFPISSFTKKLKITHKLLRL